MSISKSGTFRRGFFFLIFLFVVFNGRQPFIEDDLETTFDGEGLSMEEDIQWEMDFDGRQPLVEDYLQ